MLASPALRAQRPAGPLLRSAPRPVRLAGLVVRANKGFGAANKPKKAAEEVPVEGAGQAKKRSGRTKGKQQMRVGEAGARGAQQRIASGMAGGAAAGAPPAENLVEQIEFEERLKVLKAESDRKKADLAVSQGTGNILDNGGDPSYDNPPPLTATLFGAPAADAADSSPSSFGLSQVGLAVASLALVAVFLLANGGSDLGYATRRPSAQQAELAPEQKAELEGRLAEVNAALEANADDLEALEAAAVLHARLGQLEVAAGQLERLAGAKPGDVDVLRVLAETRGAAGEAGKAVDAYRRAWAASKESSLEVLTGLAGALAEDGKASTAIDLVRGVAAGPQAPALGDVELGLLLAKTYGQWRGHGNDAITQYDALAAAHPDDFRPPLGKALLLRQAGQEGDAQRYIMQAKFLAPPGQKALVDAFAAAGK